MVPIPDITDVATWSRFDTFMTMVTSPTSFMVVPNLSIDSKNYSCPWIIQIELKSNDNAGVPLTTYYFQIHTLS